MRMTSRCTSLGSIVLSAVVASMIVGCSRDDSTGYSPYRPAVDRDSAEHGPATENTTVAGVRQSSAIPPPKAADVEKTLPAGIGYLALTYSEINDEKNREAVATAAVGSPGSVMTSTTDSAGTSNSQTALVGAATTKKKAAKPLVVKLLIKDRTFQTVGPQDAVRVSYDDINLLKVLNMEPVTADAPKLMPDWLKDLNGKRIRIRGFMSPSFKPSGLEAFLMGRDNQVCCFPGNAKIYDLFPVKMRKGVTTEFILNRPFDVVGVFEIKPWYEDGEWMRLYQITDAIIIQ